jgi:glycosyltransferase involved in cell wall biosynthesis
MPLYLPLRDASFRADTPLFFPATTYYAAQKFFRKKKMPKWLEPLTGSDFMLKIASSMSGTTSAEGMEGMTLSMITGDDPAFRSQVDRLSAWIANHERPDIIHLSSSLLTGIAKALRRQFTIPIVCSVQDEEIWIDSLPGTHAATAWQRITENIPYIDHFVTTSEFYKKTLCRRIPQVSNVEVIYPAVDKSKYATAPCPADPVIGFFYRMNKQNGLGILAEAFAALKRKNTIPNLKLKIGGGYTAADKPFLRKIKKILHPYKEAVEWSDNYNLGEHTRFYRTITVISVPVTFEEGIGLYLCEAFTSGRPAVAPATGSIPEIVGEAGVTYHPNTSEALAGALERLLTDKDLYARSVEKAKELSDTRYNEQILAGKLAKIYEQQIQKNAYTAE